MSIIIIIRFVIITLSAVALPGVDFDDATQGVEGEGEVLFHTPRQTAESRIDGQEFQQSQNRNGNLENQFNCLIDSLRALMSIYVCLCVL